MNMARSKPNPTAPTPPEAAEPAAAPEGDVLELPEPDEKDTFDVDLDTIPINDDVLNALEPAPLAGDPTTSLSSKELVEAAMQAEKAAEKAESAADAAEGTDQEELTLMYAEKLRASAEEANRRATAAMRRNRPNAQRNPIAERTERLTRIAEGMEDEDTLPTDVEGLRAYAVASRSRNAALSLQVDQQARELAAARPILARADKITSVLMSTARTNKSRWKPVEGSIDEERGIEVLLMPLSLGLKGQSVNGEHKAIVAVMARNDEGEMVFKESHTVEWNITDMGDQYKVGR